MDALHFLNIHNERKSVIKSEICKSLSIGNTVLDFASDSCRLDINIETKSISVPLKPYMLKLFGNINIPDEGFCPTLTISAEDVISAHIYRNTTCITLSITTSCAPHLEPPIENAFRNEKYKVKLVMPINRLAKIDQALVDIFGNRYQGENTNYSRLVQSEQWRWSGVTVRRRNCLPSPLSTTSTSSLKQLRNKLIDLPPHEFHKNLERECPTSLTSITERIEPIPEEASDGSPKQRLFDQKECEHLNKISSDNNSCVKSKEPLNTDVHDDISDSFKYVTLRDNFKYKKVEDIDSDIIENTPIMEGDGNTNGKRNIANTNASSKHKTSEKKYNEPKTTDFNMTAITGFKELSAKVCRTCGMHTRKSALQGDEINVNKKNKYKIKRRHATEYTLSRCNCKNITNSNVVDQTDDSTVTRRKRKLYSSKMENTYTKIKKPMAYVSETENDSTSLSIPNKCKELEKVRKNPIKPRHFKIFRSKTPSVISSRSQNLNDVFDKLKENVESDEKITLVDKSKANEAYNFTSDSEGDDFKLQRRIHAIRTSSAGSTKHGRVTNRVSYAEKQCDSLNEKVVKKTGKRSRKKSVKTDMGIKQSKINTIPRNEITDETMRMAPSEILNTSLIIPKSHKTLEMEPVPLIREIEMEPIDDLGNDEHVETIVSEKIQSTKKNKSKKALSLKKQKVVNKKDSSLVITNNEGDKTASPLPELLVETVTTNRDDNEDSISVKMIKALSKIDDNPECNNADNMIQYPSSDILKINDIQCNVINKAKHSVEEKQNAIIQCKNKVKIKVPNVEDDLEIIDISQSISCPDKPIVTDGDSFTNAYVNLNRKPPSVTSLYQRIESRDLELQDLDLSMKEYYLKIRNDFSLDSHKSPVKDEERNCKDDREKEKKIRRKDNCGSDLMENNNMVAHGANKTTYISSITPINLPNDMFITVNERNNVLNEENISTSRHILYDNEDVQFKDANISIINNNKKMYALRKESSVDNVLLTESDCSTEADPPKTGKKRKLNLKRCDEKTTTEYSGAKITTIDSSLARTEASTTASTVDVWLKQNRETIAETPDNNFNECINASSEKLETALVAFDDRSYNIITRIFSLLSKEFCKAQDKSCLMNYFEEKFKEIEIQPREEIIKLVCDAIHKYNTSNRNQFLDIYKDLNALYRFGSETLDSNLSEHIKASLEKLETTLVAFNDRSYNVKTHIFSDLSKGSRKAQEKRQNLLKDFEEKLKEIDNQLQEIIKSVCDAVREHAISNRSQFLDIYKDLNALYRFASETSNNNLNERIKASSEKLETTLVAVDDGSFNIITHIFLHSLKESCKVQEKRRNLMKDFEEQLKEIDNHLQEEIIKSVCDCLREHIKSNRSPFLHIYKDLNALYRLVCKKT